MKSQRKQRGITFLGAVIVLSLIGFFAMLIIKIAPIYMEHAKIKSALENIEAQPDLVSKTKEDIIKMFESRLYINYVEGFKRENILITKHGGYVKVEVIYDKTENIFGNLDVLVRFDDVIEVGTD
ncbi:MAG TPA: DUF4845 domain-containing protein [Methylococcaceae bacterium]|nr:DUF4845 domain-containing protein [Methylococcaceae bacterium]